MSPSGSSVVLPLERLTRLYDGLEQLQEMWGEDDDLSEDEEEELEDGQDADIEFWTRDEDGQWMQADTPETDGWSTEEEEVPEASSIENTESLKARTELLDKLKADTNIESSHSSDASEEVSSAPDDPPPEAQSRSVRESIWKRFDILPSTPPDHAFHGSAPAQPSRSFLARLSKEYKILENSLPGSYSQILSSVYTLTDFYRYHPGSRLRRSNGPASISHNWTREHPLRRRTFRDRLAA